MTITNSQLITDALREINVINEVDTLSPEKGAECLRKLNQMMESFKESSVNLGYFKQTDTTADCPIPDWAELGITIALAVAVASKYGASVSAETAAVGSGEMGMIRRKLISEKLDNTDMTHMPIGQGHYGHGYDITKS